MAIDRATERDVVFSDRRQARGASVHSTNQFQSVRPVKWTGPAVRQAIGSKRQGPARKARGSEAGRMAFRTASAVHGDPAVRMGRHGK